ncbi:MAG TPA: TIM44-like domain-containing protein [Syntrophomonadaceae bacterium]|nr:TIM44-like domain-containing protein [Syntrophomonadaceae bacterium]
MKTLRNNRRWILISLVCLVLCIFAFSSVAVGAVGHSVSHSSSSHSSSSSSSSHSSGSSGGGIGNFLLLAYLFSHPGALVILIIIGLIIYFVVKKSGGSISDHQDDVEEYQPPHIVDLSALKAADENFSEEMFISKVNNMFIQLQEAWMEKDWKRVRPFESDELFNMHNKQLQDYIRNNTTNVVEKIAILESEIRDYHDMGITENLDVYMRVRLHDYVINDETRKVVEGYPNDEITMEYLLVMVRKKGVKTRIAENTTVTSCPNCGANVSINASGECEYCGSVVSNGDFDWVLTRMDVISQSN